MFVIQESLHASSSPSAFLPPTINSAFFFFFLFFFHSTLQLQVNFSENSAEGDLVLKTGRSLIFDRKLPDAQVTSGTRRQLQLSPRSISPFSASFVSLVSLETTRSTESYGFLFSCHDLSAACRQECRQNRTDASEGEMVEERKREETRERERETKQTYQTQNREKADRVHMSENLAARSLACFIRCSVWDRRTATTTRQSQRCREKKIDSHSLRHPEL